MRGVSGITQTRQKNTGKKIFNLKTGARLGLAGRSVLCKVSDFISNLVRF
jgi:hypothetical protein